MLSRVQIVGTTSVLWRVFEPALQSADRMGFVAWSRSSCPDTDSMTSRALRQDCGLRHERTLEEIYGGSVAVGRYNKRKEQL